MPVSSPEPAPFIAGSCDGCGARAGAEARFDLPILIALQPILDVNGRVFAQEALVRGVDGEGAGAVLAHVTDRNRYAFNQLYRTTAIRRAAELGITGSGALLSINFSPNAIYKPQSERTGAPGTIPLRPAALARGYSGPTGPRMSCRKTRLPWAYLDPSRDRLRVKAVPASRG